MVHLWFLYWARLHQLQWPNQRQHSKSTVSEHPSYHYHYFDNKLHYAPRASPNADVKIIVFSTDIQIYTTPILSISSPISGLTSVAVTAIITNMNGFIVMGVMQGAFNSSTMTIPSVSNIKSGKFSATQNLTAVQMIHTTQNYNTSFQFSGLSANTLYTFFYFCTVEDPAITALSSSVGTFSAQTLQMLVININYSPSLSFMWLMALVLFALAFWFLSFNNDESLCIMFDIINFCGLALCLSSSSCLCLCFCQGNPIGYHRLPRPLRSQRTIPSRCCPLWIDFFLLTWFYRLVSACCSSLLS